MLVQHIICQREHKFNKYDYLLFTFCCCDKCCLSSAHTVLPQGLIGALQQNVCCECRSPSDWNIDARSRQQKILDEDSIYSHQKLQLVRIRAHRTRNTTETLKSTKPKRWQGMEVDLSRLLRINSNSKRQTRKKQTKQTKASRFLCHDVSIR